MKIDLSKIKWHVGSSINVDYFDDLKSIEFNGNEYTLDAPLHIKGTITNRKEGLFSDIVVEGRINVKCDRCLDEFKYDIYIPIKEYLNNLDAPEKHDMANFYDNFDLTEIVKDNIILSLPMKFICKEDCKGLCPMCGKNLNYETCNCQHKDTDPRLNILSKLLQ